jgi:hypothetical protein
MATPSAAQKVQFETKRQHINAYEFKFQMALQKLKGLTDTIHRFNETVLQETTSRKVGRNKDAAATCSSINSLLHRLWL